MSASYPLIIQGNMPYCVRGPTAATAGQLSWICICGAIGGECRGATAGCSGNVGGDPGCGRKQRVGGGAVAGGSEWCLEASRSKIYRRSVGCFTVVGSINRASETVGGRQRAARPADRKGDRH